VKPTRAPVLFLLAGFGAAAGWLIETAMVAMGRAIAIPPATLSIALVLISVIIIVMALPVFRVVRGTARKAVDPFYATRVVLLAKASSLAGALLAGGCLAVLGFLLTRSIVPAVGSVATTIAASACAVALLVAGLVAEKMCTLPPQGDDPTATATGKD